MLEIVLTPKILGPPKSGALGLSLFSLMANPRLMRCASYIKSMQIVSQQDTKGPDTMADLVWANTNISGYEMHNSIGMVIRST